MFIRTGYRLCAFAIAALCCVPLLHAQNYDALEACRSQSLLTQDIHSCLDNYLDLMDQNLQDLTIYIDGEMRGSERAAFNRAQNSFYSYRRENCLWYLEIGGSRVQAEQVAKNCLAKMSQERLAELQSLIADYQNPLETVEPISGTADSESLEASENANTASVQPTDAEFSSDVAQLDTNSAAANSPNDASEGLSAFLGPWQVSCVGVGGAKRCTLDVSLEPVGLQGNGSFMRLNRRAEQRTTVELHFPNQPISSPDNLIWRVDNYTFGAIPGSLVSEKDGVARQIVNERRFVRDDLLPLFEGGAEVGVTLVESADSSAGQSYEATLVGFSKALTFADDYIKGELDQ